MSSKISSTNKPYYYNPDAKNSCSKKPKIRAELPLDKIKRTVLSQISNNPLYDKDKFLSYLNGYTNSELTNVLEDFIAIKKHLFAFANKKKSPKYVTTAAAPYSMRYQILKANSDSSFVRIDREYTILNNMNNTFFNLTITKENYKRYKNASKFIAKTLKLIALQESRNVAYSATSGSEKAIKELKALSDLPIKTENNGERKYEVVILHISSVKEISDTFRNTSFERNQYHKISEEKIQKQRKAFFSMLPEYIRTLNSATLRFYLVDRDGDKNISYTYVGRKSPHGYYIDKAGLMEKIRNLHNIGMKNEIFWDRHI